ncbi:hypothetical protein AN958_09981 [Leucoagaricus sp. SymC.cos]|nr:hypothetical protein AN958_09981 [Leucoagaricus sp. SymC.cos]
MASRSFTVFQDVPSSTEAVKVKPVSSNVMATRSSARFNNTPHVSSPLNDITPTDKENVDPITGERAITTTISQKRKTNALSTKPSAPLAAKKVKSMKGTKDAQPQLKKRKAAPEAEKAKGTVKKDGKAATSSRKGSKRVARKVSKLPRLEEETNKGQEPESITQTSIDSRCYELTVQPLADVSQAYEAMESAEKVSTSPTSKAKFRKDPSAEPEIQDFFPSSQTLASLPSTSTARAPSEPVESRKFSTPERKQIYAAFTFSSPSPTSERFNSPSRSGSVSRLELA